MLLVASAAAISIGASVLATRQAMQASPGKHADKLLLAPMIGIIEPCILLHPGEGANQELADGCSGAAGSAAALVESTLSGLLPRGTPARYELGYTLPVPLLQLLREQAGDWVIDRERVQRLVRTLRETERPAIVYLFSTHFATGAPIEAALAADPVNLSHTPAGPLGTQSYYGSAIHNWSFASTRTPLSARRVQAAQAVLEEICRLEPRHREKIKGVTLLGELHHLFPDFEKGMGFALPYRVTDYSEASRQGFREFLRDRYRSIERLNSATGSHWAAFDQVEPPSKDVRR